MAREHEEDAGTMRWGEEITQDGPEDRFPQSGAQHCQGLAAMLGHAERTHHVCWHRHDA